jgi:hypothetical protein
MGRARIRLAAAVACTAILLAGAAALSPAQTIYVETDGVRASFGTSLEPISLPRAKRVAVAIRLSSRIKADGRIPAIARVKIGIDSGLAIDARGVPSCSAGQLESQTSDGAAAACRAAIVGSGSAALEITLDGGAPIRTTSRLLAFNGGVAGRTTTVLVHAYISTPAPEAIVVPIALRKLSGSGYGTVALATIPKIAGGAGSLARVDLAMRRQVAAAGGRRHGYLLARCADGNLVFEPEVEFEGGSRARGVLAQSCRSRG